MADEFSSLGQSNVAFDTSGVSPVDALIQKHTETPGFSELLKNPAFISFLAELGAGLDPQGVGSAVGKATSNFVKSTATAKALAQSKKYAGLNMQELIKALGSKDSLISGIEIDPSTGKLTLKAAAPKDAAVDSGLGNILTPINTPDKTSFMDFNKRTTEFGSYLNRNFFGE